MTKFEEYLLSIGYNRFFLNNKNELEPAVGYHLSSLGVLSYRYIKDDRHIVFGLSDNGKPPTLIHPRPSITIGKEYIIDGLWHSELVKGGDDEMNRVLFDNSPEYVYEAIFNQTIKFKFNN